MPDGGRGDLVRDPRVITRRSGGSFFWSRSDTLLSYYSLGLRFVKNNRLLTMAYPQIVFAVPSRPPGPPAVWPRREDGVAVLALDAPDSPPRRAPGVTSCRDTCRYGQRQTRCGSRPRWPPWGDDVDGQRGSR